MRRTIQRLVENELSRMVLGGRLEPGDKVAVEVDVDGDELEFEIETGVYENEEQRRSAKSASVASE